MSGPPGPEAPAETGKVVSLPGRMTVAELASYLLENRQDIAGVAVVVLYDIDDYGIGIAGLSSAETHLAGGLLQSAAHDTVAVDGVVPRDSA